MHLKVDHRKTTPLKILPKIDFTTFVLSISSAAYMGLGAQGEKVDAELAKQNIDLLELLAEKTSGNLTPDEHKLLQELLYELRMKFIEVMKL
jgi:hypothetical protein